jgi:diguanylate cyclase (GGDEF)-like protein
MLWPSSSGLSLQLNPLPDATLPGLMQSPFGWLLLLACVLVQGVVHLRGVRAAQLAAATVGLVYLLAAGRAADSMVPVGVATLAFLIASAAIIAAHRHSAARMEEIIEICDIDEATQCLNRRGFARQLAYLTADSARHGGEIALVALDLDHFKQVNDRYGHLTGDQVLHEVGLLLVDAVESVGVVARMGGEEFAALLPGLDAEAAGVLAERILAELRTRRFQAMPAEARLTMSAGIAVERVATAEQGGALRARADEALYAAKRSGRDRALLWPPGVPSNSTPSGSMPAVSPHRQRRSSGRRQVWRDPPKERQ